MRHRLQAAICTDLPFRYDSVYAGSIEAQIRDLTDLRPAVLTTREIRSGNADLSEIEVIFGTWGITKFTESDLDQMPRLSAVFYAAGSVRSFAENLFKRGITVCSAWQANAYPVAEFALAHILLGCKGFFRNSAALRHPAASNWRGDAPLGPGIYQQRIGLIGQGAIGKKVLKLLEPFDLLPVTFDSYPTLDMDELAEIFRTCQVVTNHLADKPHLRKIFTADLFRLMPEGATFINTGRGAQVHEADLVRVMRERPDLTAILDVTDPEPPLHDSPLRQLPNIHLSSHISGSINQETHRMSEYMIEEFKRWSLGQPLQHEVSPQEFALLA
ncbi:MAG: hydroxyacid dehydrogenase [Oceanipulchritudo sp.]